MYPIALFTYNRLEHLQQTVNSLLSNELANKSVLYVFSDGGKDEHDQELVEKVRVYIRNLKGFQRIELEERPTNFGLAENVINGVTSVLTKHSGVIVLEDDLYLSRSFLTVMNTLLEKYQEQKKIGSISGYRYPIPVDNDMSDFFLLPRASSWGWGTWADRWMNVDWDVKDYQQFINSATQKKKFNYGGDDLVPMLQKWKLGLNDSWAVRWAYHHFKMDRYCLFPKYNLVENIGNDGSGTHSPNSMKYFNKVNHEKNYIFPDCPEVNMAGVECLQRFFSLSLIRKLINLIILNLKSSAR